MSLLQAGRCAYGIIIMAVYWMTEVMPMAATALLPVVIMPWLGVLGSKDICVCYLKVCPPRKVSISGKICIVMSTEFTQV